LAPTLPQLWTLVTLAGIFVLLGVWPLFPADLWWHVRVGQWVVENGRVPTTDLFSYTRAGEPWAYQSWLSEVVLFLLYHAGNAPLMIFAQAVAVTTAYGLVFGANRCAARGDTRWSALATLTAAVVGFANWMVRPQTLSILFFALSLYLLERQRGHQGEGYSQPYRDYALWWLVPVFALWANSHGGFVFGLALVGTHLLADLLAWLRRKRSFPRQESAVTLLCAAATLLTPLGLGLFDYVLGFVRHPITQTLNEEFKPPTTRTLDGQIFFGFVFVFVVLLLVSRYRSQPHESIRLILFGVLALMARRNEIWFGMVAAPTMAAALRYWTTRRGITQARSARRRPINLAIAALVGLLAVLSLPWLRPYLPWPRAAPGFLYAGTPVEAVAFLRDLSTPRRVYHREFYGSYMIWASPEVPVFIDTRFELYPPEQWQDYAAVYVGRYDWQDILESYGVDTLLLERKTQQALIEAATSAPDWQLAYEDEQAMVFTLQETP
jgi:hypothetical protein